MSTEPHQKYVQVQQRRTTQKASRTLKEKLLRSLNKTRSQQIYVHKLVVCTEASSTKTNVIPATLVTSEMLENKKKIKYLKYSLSLCNLLQSRNVQNQHRNQPINECLRTNTSHSTETVIPLQSVYIRRFKFPVESPL